jgi:hypothetical protein
MECDYLELKTPQTMHQLRQEHVDEVQQTRLIRMQSPQCINDLRPKMLIPDNSNSASTPRVIKCDKKKVSNQLAPADPWRGLGTETPPTRAHWLIKIPPESFFY